jgi:hypothetical protein
VRVLTHIKKLADCFGQVLVRVSYEAGIEVKGKSEHDSEEIAVPGSGGMLPLLIHRPMAPERCQPLLEQLAKQAPQSDTLRLRLLRWAGTGRANDA